ncbi:SWIM zinc finger family protein [Calothrix sp. NIES-2098]|uniref:SWIM zinc finger family protein n=1 Tax=Calothrix sp. NIES-2098 TaxID=1954171 RepID=UPI0030D74189
MSDVNLSESIIRHNANAKSFQRGEDYYRMGSVLSVTQRKNQIQAEVEGSEEEPYRVTIRFNNDELTAICTCPYDYDGWCKHIVATALTYTRQPDIIEKRPSLPQLLDRLDHVQTQRLVQELVEEHPELIDEIDGYVKAIAKPVKLTQKRQPARQITINTKQIKASVRQILRDGARYLEDGYEEDPITEELQSLIQEAVDLCAKDDAHNALAMLEAITDACVQSWDEVAEYGQENEDIVPVLDNAWCEAIYSAELTPEERTDIQINLETWQDEWDADFSLAIASLHQA